MGRTTAIALPPPYKGQNDQYPVFSIQNPYAERIENFNNENGLLNLRKGNTRFCSTTGNQTILNLASYNSSNLFMFVEDLTALFLRWYNIASGVPVLVNSVAFGGDDEIHTLLFNNYLFYFGEVTLVSSGTGIPYYNGVGWGIAAYTGLTSSQAGGNVFKNRAYFIYRNAAQYAYTGVDSISGAVTNVDLSGILSSRSFLYGIRSISMSENVTQENVQAFLFQSGEILVYSGSYPNSSDWSLISRFQVSRIIFINSIIDAKGDSFLLCETEILSLRNLFTSGYSKEKEEGIGAAIRNRWAQIVSVLIPNIGGRLITGIYDSTRDRLVISFPAYVNPTTSALEYKPFQLVYDFTLKGWYEYFQEKVGTTNDRVDCSVFHEGSCYVGVNNGSTPTGRVMKLDSKSTYVDDDIFTSSTTLPIPYKWRSAPYPTSRFGVVATVGLEVILKSDLYNSMNWKLIGDLGAVSTSNQVVPASNGTNITKTFINIGLESNIVQSELTGSSSTSSVGIQIYATNLWVNPSDAITR